MKRFLDEAGKKHVYLAHGTLLDRDVAFALIKADGPDESGLQSAVAGRARVLREAQAMGRLGSHPHIVTVFDLGQEPLPGQSSQPDMVSELMGGGDVEGLIENAPDQRAAPEPGDYERVTSRPPFVRDNLVPIIGQHLNTPPIAPIRCTTPLYLTHVS